MFVPQMAVDLPLRHRSRMPLGDFMCVRVECAATVTDPWNPDERVILLPATLPTAALPTALHAVLAELGIPQPDSGALCFCGAPIRVPQPTHR